LCGEGPHVKPMPFVVGVLSQPFKVGLGFTFAARKYTASGPVVGVMASPTNGP